MFRQLLPPEVSNDRVVSAMNIAAFRHEITTLQQLRSIFLQKPLDRFRARFVRTYVDIEGALRCRTPVNYGENRSDNAALLHAESPVVTREPALLA